MSSDVMTLSLAGNSRTFTGASGSLVLVTTTSVA
jgi:hypothetical protein